jgi:hypothetical protein
MEPSFVFQDNVIFRRFSGDVDVKMVISSWDYIFDYVSEIDCYKGVITDFLEANLMMDVPDLEVLMEYMNDKLEVFRKLKLAVLIDNPKVILPILAGRRKFEYRIRPFVTEKAAISWVRS